MTLVRNKLILYSQSYGNFVKFLEWSQRKKGFVAIGETKKIDRLQLDATIGLAVHGDQVTLIGRYGKCRVYDVKLGASQAGD